MNNYFKVLASSLLLLMSAADTLFAAEKGVSINVSCSIPVVPGLNAPLLTPETTASLPSEPMPEGATTPQKTTYVAHPPIPSGTNDFILAKAEEERGSVETVYNR